MEKVNEELKSKGLSDDSIKQLQPIINLKGSDEEKINDLKKILKDSFKNLLPEEIFNRKKQGFEVPLLKWFQTELKSMITDDLLDDNFIREQNLFNPEEIKKLKQQLFSNNPGEIHARIWALIVFQYWWKKYMV